MEKFGNPFLHMDVPFVAKRGKWYIITGKRIIFVSDYIGYIKYGNQ